MSWKNYFRTTWSCHDLSYRRFPLFLLLFLVGGIASLRASSSGEIAWETNYQTALALAKEKGKPLMLDFWATWCKPCTRMDQEIWPDKEAVEASKKFVCVSINVDNNMPVASHYQVQGIPAIIFTDPWENVVVHFKGFTKTPQLLGVMNSFPSDFSPVRKWQSVLKEDKKNVEALLKVGEFYRRGGLCRLSLDYYKTVLQTKEAREEPEYAAQAILGMGVNYLKLSDYKKAVKTYKIYLKKFPNGEQKDLVLLGLVTAYLGRGKLTDAEKTFAVLQNQYPRSNAEQQASANIRQYRSQGK